MAKFTVKILSKQGVQEEFTSEMHNLDQAVRIATTALANPEMFANPAESIEIYDADNTLLAAIAYQQPTIH